jgi:hypothetical protein
MIVLNFAHPLTEDQKAKIEDLTGQKIERVISIPTQIDHQQPLAPQVVALADAVGFSPMEWQTPPLLVNPPSLNFIAVALLAEIHGRCGYFPPCIRLRPVKDALPPRYEVAEVIDLEAMREEAVHRWWKEVYR